MISGSRRFVFVATTGSQEPPGKRSLFCLHLAFLLPLVCRRQAWQGKQTDLNSCGVREKVQTLGEAESLLLLLWGQCASGNLSFSHLQGLSFIPYSRELAVIRVWMAF